MYVLRDYQQAAVNAVYDHIRNRATNPCVVIPTAGGKTPVIATLCRDSVTAWNGRVLILAHVKELLQQSADKLQAICPTVRVGIYSAGLKRRETDAPVIIAGIQSVHDKATLLGNFDLVIVDEAHLIGEEGMYRKLIADLQEINPDLRVIGLTATPYRLSSGAICKPDGILNEVCYEVSVKVLMNRQFLCKMVSKAALAQVDTSALRVVRGEFDPEQSARLFDDAAEPAALEILERTIGSQRNSVLIFCQNIAHARTVARILRGKAESIRVEGRKQLASVEGLFGERADPAIVADYLDDAGRPTDALRYSLADAMGVAEIYGDTHADDRAEILADFKAGKIKYLINVGVLTTGFDAPNIDCVCLLRATASAGLFYQMVGRGFRIHPDKTDCLVLDFGENVKRHGPVDCIRPKVKGDSQADGGKVCPECREVVATNASVCPECGHAWEQAARKASGHNSRAGSEDIVSGEPKTEARPVLATTYKVHTKKGAADDAPKTLRATHQLSFNEWVSEWICVEHPTGSFANNKAEDWWNLRSVVPMPVTAVEAVAAAEYGWLAPTEEVTIRTTPGKTFPEVTRSKVASKPLCSAPCPKCDARDRQVVMPHDEPRFPFKVACGLCLHTHRYVDSQVAEVFGVFDPGAEEFRGEILFEPDESLIPRDVPPSEFEVEDENPF